MQDIKVKTSKSFVTEVLQEGNTGPLVASGKPSRTWDFTINNYSVTDVEWVNKLDVKRIRAAYEVGDCGTPHIQGKVTFPRPFRLSALKKLHPKAHFEVSICADFNYINKLDSKIFIDIDNTKQGNRCDLMEMYKEIKGGLPLKEFVDSYPSTYIRYKNGIEAIYNIVQKPRDFKPTVIWLWGESGAGKTKYVFDRHKFDDIWTAPDELKFFNNYMNQEVALFDDFRGHSCKFNEFLKIIDRYPYTCNVKGGCKHFNSKFIYITSIRQPSETWSFIVDEPLKQLTRRLSEIIHIH